MDDRWGPDPTRRLWERWRRPVLIVLAVVFVINQADRLTSGRPFVIATGVGLAAFWISLLASRGAPAPERRTIAAAWRENARRRLLLFGFWTLAATAWLIVAGALYALHPANVVVVAFPALLLVAAWWTYATANRLAELHQRAVNA